MRAKHLLIPAAILAVATALVPPPAARGKDAPPPAPAAPATEPSRSPQDVMKNLDAKIEANPLIEPTRRPAAPRGAGDIPTAGGRATLDPAILGAAPGMPQPKLRHEGEFIVNRLGRISHAPAAGQVLFTFESESKTASDPPVILLPCRMLESMEELVQERGENIVFILSGQVTTYHAANYVLPTMMKLAVDKGNLQK